MELHIRATEHHLPYGITQCGTCQLTQLNTFRLNPSKTGGYSIYILQRDGRLSWPRLLVTYRPQKVAHPRTNPAMHSCGRSRAHSLLDALHCQAKDVVYFWHLFFLHLPKVPNICPILTLLYMCMWMSMHECSRLVFKSCRPIWVQRIALFAFTSAFSCSFIMFINLHFNIRFLVLGLLFVNVLLICLVWNEPSLIDWPLEHHSVHAWCHYSYTCTVHFVQERDEDWLPDDNAN